LNCQFKKRGQWWEEDAVATKIMVMALRLFGPEEEFGIAKRKI
jgi:hypothetical protein